ncbi:ArsR/SmtB family transcription factor [Gimesia aquarii]|uniref:Transcriptional repressor SdpR n=1 Tax=Gimesia aquarii TaxID=2527964 RepID=A0A517VYZ2_9PLAN|nr:metalloregulator ArsR/SmtB family transcription factor [Gimesia aquarii]QDT98235.1 Transcriptional repressor SdpR [Gimesia aquarii]
MTAMPRSPTTTDAFNAIAEERRREIIHHLAGQERSVNDLVDSMGVAQPQVSKHLRVLREVGLVNVRQDGKHRWYSLNARQLKPVFDWVQTFERFWDHQLAGVKALAEAKAKAAKQEKSKKEKEG